MITDIGAPRRRCLGKATDMADEMISTTFILDEHTVVADEPCSSATLIAQFSDGYFALTITSGGSLVLGFEGESPTSIRMRDLHDLVRLKQGDTLQ
ncbi:MAG: hypothetical protein HY912_18870 [Desulfomonile tiedjei]|uniref:Uncharacterized protein n=1 Tax=Desulfomonile tiedjei TaxID=2358 RepID=A0A9D6V464_9BACT|nr:hypothetical protein [Desulfomonile tiedjei]